MNSLKERTKVDNWEGGWYVSTGADSWRFERKHFAELFAEKIEDENFLNGVLDHEHNHNWDRCEQTACEGYIWQLIQGLD